MQLEKKETNTRERIIELVINGQSYGTYTLTGNGIETSTVENINIEGEFTIELKHVSTYAGDSRT